MKRGRDGVWVGIRMDGGMEGWMYVCMAVYTWRIEEARGRERERETAEREKERAWVPACVGVWVGGHTGEGGCE